MDSHHYDSTKPYLKSLFIYTQLNTTRMQRSEWKMAKKLEIGISSNIEIKVSIPVVALGK